MASELIGFNKFSNEEYQDYHGILRESFYLGLVSGGNFPGGLGTGRAFVDEK